VIELVRRLDAIKSERAKLADESRSVQAQIAALMGDSKTTTPSHEKPSTMEQPNLDLNGATVPTSDPASTPDLGPLGFGELSYAKRVFQMVKAGALPDTPILALQLYGENNDRNRNKARAVLYFLEKRQGWIRRMPDGGWEVDSSKLPDL